MKVDKETEKMMQNLGIAMLDTQTGIELFYKLQLTNAISLTPDIQYWFRNDKNSYDVQTWIFGLRSEIEF